MVRQSLQLQSPLPHRPIGQTYGLLFLVLFASLILWGLVTVSIKAIVNELLTTREPLFIGSLIYTLLGMAVLTVTYTISRRGREMKREFDQFELLHLGGVIGILLFACFYLLLSFTELPIFPDDMIAVILTGPVGMGGLALVYARLEAFDIQIAAPSRDALPHTIGTIVLAMIVGLIWVIAVVSFDFIGPQFSFSGSTTPELSAGDVLLNTVLLGCMTGIGWGVLYNGAIQENLREVVGPEQAVGALIAIIGILWVIAGIFFQTTDMIVMAGTAMAAVLLSLFAAMVAVWGIERVVQILDVEHTLFLATSVSILVVTIVLLALSLLLTSSLGLILVGLSLSVVAALASLGYEYSRSVWVPALVFSAYFICSDVNIGLYVIS